MSSFFTLQHKLHIRDVPQCHPNPTRDELAESELHSQFSYLTCREEDRKDGDRADLVRLRCASGRGEHRPAKSLRAGSERSAVQSHQGAKAGAERGGVCVVPMHGECFVM